MKRNIAILVIGLLLVIGIVVIANAAGLWQRVWLKGNSIEAEASPVVKSLRLVGCEDDVCVYIVDGDYMTKCYLGVDQLKWINGNRFAIVCP